MLHKTQFVLLTEPTNVRASLSGQKYNQEFREDFTSGHPYLEVIGTETMLWEWGVCSRQVSKVTRKRAMT